MKDSAVFNHLHAYSSYQNSLKTGINGTQIKHIHKFIMAKIKHTYWYTTAEIHINWHSLPQLCGLYHGKDSFKMHQRSLARYSHPQATHNPPPPHQDIKINIMHSSIISLDDTNMVIIGITQPTQFHPQHSS